MEQREQGYLSEVKAYLDSNPKATTWKKAADFYKQLTGITDNCQKCNFYTYINALTALFNTPNSMEVKSKLVNYTLRPHLKNEGHLVYFGGEKVAIADLTDAFAAMCCKAGLPWFDKVSNLQSAIEDAEVIEEPTTEAVKVEIEENTEGLVELN